MCKKNIYKVFIFCLLFFTTVFSHAQNRISVQATTDKNKILIGERLRLTFETKYPAGKQIPFFSIDSIPHFIIISKEKTDTTENSGVISLKQIFNITSFDSGHWVIPSFTLSKKYKTDTVPVDVTFSDFDPAQNYHDIKDIIEVNPAKEKNNWWYYVAGGALLIILLALIFFRKKKKPEIPAAPLVDPYKEAMEQLEKIKKTSVTDKEYYSALVNIFRLYIFKSRGIQSLQKTTDDLVIQLKSLKLDKQQYEQLSQTLRVSDFVKFAKYVPAKEDNAVAFETIKRSIQLIEQNK